MRLSADSGVFYVSQNKKTSEDQTEQFHFLSTSRYGIHQQSQVSFGLIKMIKLKFALIYINL